MGQKFANFAEARVATPPSGTGGLSFSVAAGKGSLFPTLAAGDTFYGVFTNSTRSTFEIVKISARTGDAMTIAAASRGLDGSSAQSWTASDYFYAAPPALVWALIAAVLEGQLAFPATQNPSADPNTLDDYEEFNWVPVLSANVTPGTHTYHGDTYGRGTKVGRQVHLSGRIRLTAKDAAAAGTIIITGVPVAASSAGQAAFTVSGYSGLTLTAGYTQVGLNIDVSGTTLVPVQSGSGVAGQGFAAAAFSAALDITFSGSYPVS